MRSTIAKSLVTSAMTLPGSFLFYLNEFCKQMDTLTGIINLVSDLVTSVAVPLLGALMFYDIRRRSENAKAKQAEAEARAAEEENITSYAQEWKELYEKKEARVNELERQAEADRLRIRELTEKNMLLSRDFQKAHFLRCEVNQCGDRKPPRWLLTAANRKQRAKQNERNERNETNETNETKTKGGNTPT